MSSTTRTILNGAIEAESTKHGAYLVPSIMTYAAMPLIQSGLLGLQRGPLNAPGLWVFITPAGKAAL